MGLTLGNATPALTAASLINNQAGLHEKSKERRNANCHHRWAPGGSMIRKMKTRLPIALVVLGIALTIVWITVLGWFPLQLFVSTIQSLRLLPMG